MNIKNIMKNWKTSSAGLISIITGVSLFLNDKTKLAEAITAVLAGIGLLYAADVDQAPPASPAA